MNKTIKRNSVERKKFVGVLCLFDFGRILKDFFKRVKTALRCRVRFSRYVLWLWANWIRITLFFWAIGPAARRQGGSAVFWISHSGFLSETQFKNTIWFYHIYKKIARKKQWIFKNNLKIFDFCKKFSPRKIKRKRVSDRFCLSYRTKFQNGEIYPTIGRCGICFFAVRRFCGAAFFHTRAHAHVGICAPAHTCATHAHLLLAREERNFSCRRFMIVLRSFFIRRAPKKKDYGNFGEKKCGTIHNSGKKREIRLETAEKRLNNGFLRRWKGDIRQKNSKTGEKKGKKKKSEKN